MALKKDAVEKFFNTSKKHAQTRSIPLSLSDEIATSLDLQTSHKTHTNLTQNPTQTSHKSLHKLDTNATQLSEEKGTDSEKPNTQPNTSTKLYLTQTPHKHHTKQEITFNINNIIGLQKKILFYIYNQCKLLATYEIILSINTLSEQLGIRLGSINTTLTRLEKLNVLQKLEYKNGRGGWKRFKLNEMTYKEMLFSETSHKPHTNFTRSYYKPDTQPNTQPYTNSSSSSGNNILNKTTTTEQKFKLDEDWENIDITPLQEIGFTKTHLIQIASQNYLSPEITQNSIYAFAFDLQENEKIKAIKGDPINFFMGILRNGKPYTPPSNYESPQDKAMRLYLEQMRLIEQKRADIERETFELAFNDWFYKLPDKEKLDLLPNQFRTRGVEGNKILQNIAKSHFEKEIWLNIKASKIIKQTD